jgi:hypothetical protein
VSELPLHDTSSRNGFFVYLARATERDLQFQADLETNPRRMHLRELGGDPALGVFVPAD